MSNPADRLTRWILARAQEENLTVLKQVYRDTAKTVASEELASRLEGIANELDVIEGIHTQLDRNSGPSDVKVVSAYLDALVDLIPAQNAVQMAFHRLNRSLRFDHHQERDQLLPLLANAAKLLAKAAMHAENFARHEETHDLASTPAPDSQALQRPPQPEPHRRIISNDVPAQ